MNNELKQFEQEAIELERLINRYYVLSNMGYSNQLIVKDFLNHLVIEHNLTIYNVNRLIETYVYTQDYEDTNTHSCDYSIIDNSSYCIISTMWGNKKWNTHNTKIRPQTIRTFNQQLSFIIDGFNDFNMREIDTGDSLVLKYVDEKKMVVINRISTLFQAKKVAEALDKGDVTELDILVSSSFTDIDPIEEQIIEAFECKDTDYVLLEPIPGKNNAETVAFRSPRLQSTFKRMYRENPDKQLVLWRDGHYQYLNSIGLDREIMRGSETTYQEKYQAYKSYIATNKGHHTQLLIFGIGLFHNQPIQLVSDIMKVGKLPTREEIERVRVSAKKVQKYKNAFMWTDHSINVYCAKIDEYCDLMLETIKKFPDGVVKELQKAKCLISDCNRVVLSDFSRCKTHLLQLDQGAN